MSQIGAVHEEMLEDYVAASKKAIADYIFKNPQSRERALVIMVPDPVQEWGSVPFVGLWDFYIRFARYGPVHILGDPVMAESVSL